MIFRLYDLFLRAFPPYRSDWLFMVVAQPSRWSHNSGQCTLYTVQIKLKPRAYRYSLHDNMMICITNASYLPVMAYELRSIFVMGRRLQSLHRPSCIHVQPTIP